ncbi:toll-like receptor 2 [Branchiostoma floridae]|uniref:Toll-like receptor 2 n=1 Tax=Branchiostoma floridae TaxID=7739 RepID=A0A9J7LGL1_BRAFL|nr:toll-like receptor 2 [Branchiostoma floridae]
MAGRHFVVFLLVQMTFFCTKAVGQGECDTQGVGPCVFCQEGDLSGYQGSLSCIIEDVVSIPKCLLSGVPSLDILGRQEGQPSEGYPDILPASGLTPPTRRRARIQHILQQDPPDDNCTFFAQFDPDNYTISALVLYLNSSDIADFPQDLLQDLLMLEHLVIEGLQMPTPPPMKGLSSLKTISMTNNGIQTLNLTNVKGLAEVTSIKLTGNDLGKIPFHAFAKSTLVKLEDIMLDSNKISVIQEDAFAGLPSLKVLDLNGNVIQILNKAILHQLEHVVKLNLSNNAIHTLEAETFSEMKDLQVLDLSQNNMTFTAEAPALLFAGPKNLTSLYLAQNLIRGCPEGLGSAVPYLQHLDLQKNNISVFSETFLKGLGSLKEIDLSGNPFSCTCDMEWLFDWFEENSTLAFINWKDYECYYPRHSRGVNFEHFNPEVLKCDHTDHTRLGLSLGISLTLAVLVIVLAAVLYYHCRWRVKYGWFVLCGKKGEQIEQKVEDEYFKYEAFLSYCSNDRWWVIDELIPKVENCPPPTYKMCLDIRDFEDGPKDQNNIIAAMDESRKTMFVISSSFLRSKRCLWELEMSKNKRYGKSKDDLIFVLLEEVPQSKMPKLLQKVMMGRKYLRWPENPRQRDAFWQCLRESFKTNIFKRQGNRMEMQQI